MKKVVDVEPRKVIRRLLVGAVTVGVSGATAFMASPVASAAPATNPKIAFVREKGGENHIFVMNQDGTKPTDVSRAEASNPAWSADGTKLAFTSSRATVDRPQVCVMNADGSQPTRLTRDAGHDSHPSWSPDGSKIVYEGEDGIFVLTVKTKAVRRLTQGSDGQPAWSPDGTKIAFERSRDVPSPTNTTGRDQIDELWTMAPDGTQPKLLDSPPVSFSGPTTTIMGQDAFPAWSPDGTRIAFEGNRDANNGISLMNADGSNITTVTRPQGTDTFPSWSPDGTKIAFTRTLEPVLSSHDQVYTVNVDGSGATALTSSAAGATQPAWQPKKSGKPHA